ncbi:hypothetical protein [Sphingomonas pituitosa]|uniref:hypothetical protein n=1 Tax=Sphingomonas pituitosa TaxID=99597 RepID=UPI000836AB04|nr:hypothetical protein [Sphingomonas pituitosa]
MSRHRSRITLLAPAPRALELIRWHTPAGAQALGYIQRGEDQGRLLRLASGSLVIQLPTGAIGTLDQRKAQAMLDGENNAPPNP